MSEARIEALEAAVAELREQLLAATKRDARSRTMRQSLHCPACGGAKLLHFRRIKEMGHDELLNLTLQKEYSGFWGLKLSAGALEVFACRNCRLIEWHAVSLDEVVPDGKMVIEIDGDAAPPPAAPGPYR